MPQDRIDPDGDNSTASSNRSGSFDELLSRELDSPTVIDLEPDSTIEHAYGAALDAYGDEEVDLDGASLRAELLGVAPPPSPSSSTATSRSSAVSPVSPVSPPVPVAGRTDSSPLVADLTKTVRGFEQRDFWDRFDEAAASAELFSVPPAAITVVVGALNVATAVARRCISQHWVGDCEVFVLTDQEQVPGEPTWSTCRRPSDIMAVLEDGGSDFPLIVLDIPRELSTWVRPFVGRMREAGVGLVHYVLDGDPSDEDLATWHGELGRPSVLDLAAPVPAERVLELLDRGEPVCSVAGMPITTELLLALRLNAS